MKRNQFHIPRYKDRICTKEWMHSVRIKEFWVPKSPEVKTRICADIPNKELIFEEF